MKRIVIATALIMVTALLAGCGAQQSAPASTEAAVATSAATSAASVAATETVKETVAPAAAETASQADNGTIDIEKAKSAALADAGFEASQVRFTKQALETDDGVQKYEIEFIADGYEYEYDIDPKTGSIIEKKKELAD